MVVLLSLPKMLHCLETESGGKEREREGVGEGEREMTLEGLIRRI